MVSRWTSLLLIATLLFAAPALAVAAPPQPAQPAAQAAGGGSVVSDLIHFTSSLSQFFGNAISAMNDAIGFLTGGVQAAGHYQQGTDIINDMLQNGPPHPQQQQPAASQPAASQPAATPAVPTPAHEQAGAATQATEMPAAEFSKYVGQFADLSKDEKKVAAKLRKDPNNAGLKQVLGDLRKTREANRNKILFALNQDIETKKFDKLHLLIDYLNSHDGQTVKFFLEIVDETRTKLRFQLIQAQNMGLSMDIELIEGKLELVMKFTAGGR